MDFNVELTYKEEYLPTPRHRKLRTREVTEPVTVSVRECAAAEAPVALIVHDLARYADNILPTEFRFYDGEFYTPVLNHDMVVPENRIVARQPFDVTKLGRYFRNHSHPNKEEALAQFQEKAEQYLIIDGALWQRTGEPRYEICTFGLGHNHGSTALMISTHYNGNKPWDCYYSALEHDKAIADAVETARRRGDTESIPRIESKRYRIDVLDPSAVRLDPKAWGGKGDDFLNTLHALTDSSDSIAESAALVMAVTGMEMKKTPSLDETISAARQKTTENQTTNPARETER